MLALVFFLAVGVIIALMARQTVNLKRSIQPVATVHLGRYLGGLPGRTTPLEGVTGYISAREIVFVYGLNNVIVGRVPITELTTWSVEDKSAMLQRLTATRMLTLGVFALAAPKKRKIESFLLHLAWQSSGEAERHALFELDGSAARARANELAEALHQHLPVPRAAAALLAADERPCPFCAETIKMAAKICRHCQRETGPAVAS